VPADCDDGEPCTADACTPSGCRHDARSGFAAATCAFDVGVPPAGCAGDAPPASIARRFTQAKSFLDRGAGQANPRKARAFVAKASKALRKAAKVVEKAKRKATISSGCAAALATVVGRAESRTDALLQRL
jgi:hypothetical protein